MLYHPTIFAAAVLCGLLAVPVQAAECSAVTFRIHGTSLLPFAADGAEIDGHTGDCGGEPARGQLALLQAPGGKGLPLIKIVAGLPGDRFKMRRSGNGWHLQINGAAAKNSAGERYLFDDGRAQMLRLYEQDNHGVIPPRAYLVLGDNPHGTNDFHPLRPDRQG